jgi:hypothetical protein
MNSRKTLPTMIKPFAHVHSTLSALGFRVAPSCEGCLYELLFRDPLTQREYAYRLPTYTQEDGQTFVPLGDAGFQAEEAVPIEAKEAARDMLTELIAYLSNEPRKRRPLLSHTMNGRMTGSEAEVVRLGKVMASIPTNSEVQASGMVPDPIQ